MLVPVSILILRLFYSDRMQLSSGMHFEDFVRIHGMNTLIGYYLSWVQSQVAEDPRSTPPMPKREDITLGEMKDFYIKADWKSRTGITFEQYLLENPDPQFLLDATYQDELENFKKNSHQEPNESMQKGYGPNYGPGFTNLPKTTGANMAGWPENQPQDAFTTAMKAWGSHDPKTPLERPEEGFKPGFEI